MRATSSEDAPTAVRPRTPKILVVNDAPDFLALMREVLGTEGGYEVATLDQSEGVIEQATSAVPDLLIMDLVFRQGPTGLEVAERLAASAATRGIPILFCTALDRAHIPEQLWTLARSNSHRVIFKPFDLSELLSVVADMVGQSSRM
jgi:CheY-like chemotaxis protein